MMDDDRLKRIEHDIAVGRTLPGTNRYDLDTMAALIAEVRRLRRALTVLRPESVPVDPNAAKL